MVESCYVEVFCIKKQIITFDFAEFAIVIEYNKEQNLNSLSVYWGESYNKYFMGYVSRIISDEFVETVKIDRDAFNRIRGIYKKCQQPIYNKGLLSLLKSNFKEYMEYYNASV